jgi:hypothetical protein
MLLQKMLHQSGFANPPAAGNHGQITSRFRIIGYLCQTFELFFAAVEFHDNLPCPDQRSGLRIVLFGMIRIGTISIQILSEKRNDFCARPIVGEISVHLQNRSIKIPWTQHLIFIYLEGGIKQACPGARRGSLWRRRRHAVPQARVSHFRGWDKQVLFFIILSSIILSFKNFCFFCIH